MPVAKRAKPPKDSCPSHDIPDLTMAPSNPFDPSLAFRMRELVAKGLTPSSALDLLMRLIAEVPAASKESMDHIKVLDKLMNTARAMLETKLKTEEASAIAARIDDLEARVDSLTASGRGPTVCVPEE